MAARPPLTVTDIAWSVLFLVLLLVLMGGAMFIAAAYVTPALLGSPNYVPREGMVKVTEAAVLFGGMGVGIAAALAAIAVLSRRFVSMATHQRWVLQLEGGAAPLSPLVRWLSRRLAKHMQPRKGPNAL